jgi:hypothetical protein
VTTDALAQLRRTSLFLLVGEALGGLVGTLLFLGSFGICGMTGLFFPGFLALCFGSICMAANLLVLRRIRRTAASMAGLLTSWAWVGFPIVLLTLLELTFILRGWV